LELVRGMLDRCARARRLGLKIGADASHSGLRLQCGFVDVNRVSFS